MTQSDLAQIKGIGSETISLLNKLKINSKSDLVKHLPRRYIDYSNILEINKIRPGLVSLRVRLKSIGSRHTARRGMHLTTATAYDKTGAINIIWFNQPYRSKSLSTVTEYYLSGEFAMNNGRLSIINPSLEPVDGFNLSVARIVPIYPETKGLSSKSIRKFIYELKNEIDNSPESIPTKIAKKYHLPSLPHTLWQLHFPDSSDSLELAKNRMAFDELLAVNLAIIAESKDQLNLQAPKIAFNLSSQLELLKKFKFQLTPGQKQCAWQIIQDLNHTKPSSRLLLGDVGSGKTAVAAQAINQVISAGFKAFLIAPTESLAKQHYKSFIELGFPTELLIAKTKLAKKRELINQINSEQFSGLYIGTHALFNQAINCPNLALVIYDEQHRFGVNQRRTLLRRTTKFFPHVLSMSATPIPRSLALTLFGQISISRLTTKPHGRLPIITTIANPSAIDSVIKQIENELANNLSIIIISPKIEENLDDTTVVSIATLKRKYSKFAKIKAAGIEVLHSQLHSEEKERILSDFYLKKFRVLISTTVIEVGIDIPHASLIIIEGAENFGLAQLHQLRGRVGRAAFQSYCIVIPSQDNLIPERLRYFARESSGFKLAEFDLNSRGPGTIFGKLQSGELDLRFVSWENKTVIELAHKAAKQIDQEFTEQELSNYLKSSRDKWQNTTNLN